MAVGPLAQLALNRVMVRALREQVAELTANAEQRADHRAREAYDAGLRRGRAAWPLALLFGVVVGALLIAWFC